MDVSVLAPSAVHDEAFRRRLLTYLRQSASPGAAVALLRMNTQIDVRSVLPSIRVPTLVLHRRDDTEVLVDEGRWIASRIPGARFVELPGADHLPWVGDSDAALDELQEFLTGVRRGVEPDRVLATVLFTDIVGSTERAVAAGDRAWAGLLAAHDGAVRRELERFRGVEVDTAGDGFFASFDGPARAIRCALAIREAVRAFGLEVRAGVHTGECERAAGKLRGVAVSIGARVAARAEPGEVLVSRTVVDLVAGSGLGFRERGEHELKGVPGTWPLFAVVP
jgi:class 3 adenylate cyclase